MSISKISFTGLLEVLNVKSKYICQPNPNGTVKLLNYFIILPLFHHMVHYEDITFSEVGFFEKRL